MECHSFHRNKGWKRADAEAYLQRYKGVTNLIWLDGVKGIAISDDHIDGTARFTNGDTIVTFAREDFEIRKMYDILAKATNVKGEPYK
jgi:agmatine deiminase